MSSTVIPGLRYTDAPAAIDWLERVFGFKRRLVVEDGAGGITHAELTLGAGMLMLGSAHDDEFGKWVKTPGELGAGTQSAYIVVADADAVYVRAKAAGAKIVREIADKPYGGRDFICEDLEGHIWSVGTYDPWSGEHQ